MWRVFQYPGQERYTSVAVSVQNQMRCQSPRNDAFKYMTDTKQDVEAVPISPTSAVHQGCSVGSKHDEVSKPQINDAFKHITDGVQEDVEAVPIYPTSAVHQGCSVGSKPNEVSKPQINDAFKHMTDTKQDVEAVPISPTSAVHQGCSVGSKQDEVSKPQINDAFKHITDTKQDVEAVPISPTAAVHQGCSVGSKQDEVSKPHINDAFKHITDNGVNSESEDSNDEEEIHEADDLTENAIEEDMETVPVSTLGAVQGCSVRSNPDKVTEPKKSGNNRPKTGEVVKLTEHQHRLLKTLFKTNIAMRRELQKDECEKVSRKHDALQNLTWKKIKNTVHNWIMAEKRKTKRY
ncbi:uncharacterized protein LOC127874419 isoform X1 [Dreissena polymorpha]|uniref:uncharacterized protein LOC127845673 isoform X7 n=1 Tax=Dreissena polymorpha TaxID=45954 RepID=UPI0022643C24|nr:uncharacterized protein LOC127845673 isoform X7 [Dreissena polymorpha]XP_052272666.1 uncharacterized protein LOC127873065 isoform X7 [Dreissena polymorpha]XP_052274683.1 uncharacterized protein LOC127874419 isoform X1 [Dreissena polymorpha]